MGTEQIVLARDACRRGHQAIDLREALSGDGLLWIGTDPYCDARPRVAALTAAGGR